MDADLALALELADAADEITLRRFRARDLVVEHKPDLTPVSEADRAVEEMVRARLEASRPDDGVLGEELGELRATNGRRWIVDPIDGTANYVRGVPVYATLLAFEHDGVIEVGVASAPALARRWWAVRGGGAWCNGDRIQVSRVAAIEDAHLAYDSVRDFAPLGLEESFLDLTRRVWRSRGFGDFWSHVLVAEGAVDVAIEPSVNVWDVAPLLVIVEEAGGRLTDLGGARRCDGGSVLTTNGLLHDAVLTALDAGGAS